MKTQDTQSCLQQIVLSSILRWVWKTTNEDKLTVYELYMEPQLKSVKRRERYQLCYLDPSLFRFNLIYLINWKHYMHDQFSSRKRRPWLWMNPIHDDGRRTVELFCDSVFGTLFLDALQILVERYLYQTVLTW